MVRSAIATTEELVFPYFINPLCEHRLHRIDEVPIMRSFFMDERLEVATCVD